MMPSEGSIQRRCHTHIDVIHPKGGGTRRGSEETQVHLAASLDGPMFVCINKLYERGEKREERGEKKERQE